MSFSINSPDYPIEKPPTKSPFSGFVQNSMFNVFNLMDTNNFVKKPFFYFLQASVKKLRSYFGNLKYDLLIFFIPPDKLKMFISLKQSCQ